MAYGTLKVDTIENTNGQTGNAIGPGFKNRIINGAMVIDQRNAGAAVTASTSTYVVDRWDIYNNTPTGVWTGQRSTTAPAGFSNSFVFTVSTAYTMSASYASFVSTKIEGYNTADFNWGTSDAKNITISFWVRSSVTGTFSGCVSNSAGNRTYPFTYTINAANTWENKSVTVPGDTTGTWEKTTSTGIWLIFSQGCGSNRQGTANAWGTGLVFAATGETQLVATAGATWYITGVQLEVGSTATSFDYRPYGTELALCQRYYQQTNIQTGAVYGSGNADSTTGGWITFFGTIFRASPTVTYTGSLQFFINAGTVSINAINNGAFTNFGGVSVRFGTAGSLNATYPLMLYANGACTVNFNAEL